MRPDRPLRAEDPYERDVADEDNRRMRAASGRVDDRRPLVAFLYELARDLVPTGSLEGKIDRIAAGSDAAGPYRFTNGWLAQWAQDAAGRLEHPERLDAGVDLTLDERAAVWVPWRAIAEQLLRRLEERENPRDYRPDPGLAYEHIVALSDVLLASNGPPVEVELHRGRTDDELVVLVRRPAADRAALARHATGE